MFGGCCCHCNRLMCHCSFSRTALDRRQNISTSVVKSRKRRERISVRVVGWCTVDVKRLPPLTKACQSHLYSLMLA